MSDFPFGDIIVLGAVAAFILLRYRSMLGEQRGRDKPDVKRKAIEDVERIIQLPSKPEVLKPVAASSDLIAGYDPTLRDTLKSFQKFDPEFTPEEFLDGAKSAFEMLITAYRNADRDTLKMLLSKELFDNFDKALKEEIDAGKRTQGTVIAISNAELTDASLKGSIATVSVKFVSDQIQVVRDKDNVIIEGNASHEVEIDDHWVFTRDLKSNNPNWTITET
jgi:predicted lipid-binding transport protein (Tim44 family)